MRKVADLSAAVDRGGRRICRLMLYASPEETPLFRYSTPSDGPCDYDEWYATVADAEAASQKRFGVKRENWRSIPNLPPDCRPDRIAPVRGTANDAGRPP